MLIHVDAHMAWFHYVDDDTGLSELAEDPDPVILYTVRTPENVFELDVEELDVLYEWIWGQGD